jgi:hypothetical protein
LSAEDFLELTVPLKRPWVVFQQVGQIVGGHDVADGDDFDVLADEALFDEGTENETADAAKTVDGDFNGHSSRSGSKSPETAPERHEV